MLAHTHTNICMQDGATNRIKREMDVQKFNAPGCKIPLFLISTRAGGQGINLATADVVCLYDTCWNPQVDLQAQDRSHRIGQKKQVRVFRLIAQHTMEERILNRSRQKLVLDALVIKKAGETSGLSTHIAENDDTSDEAAMAKLSLSQIWSMLSYGADMYRDPTSSINLRPSLTDADLDTIIDEGRIVDAEAEGEEEEDDLAKHGEDGLWHDEKEEVMMQIEDKEEQEASGMVGLGVKARQVLSKASAADLMAYLREHAELKGLSTWSAKGVLLARVILHLRARNLKIDGYSIFDLQPGILKQMCASRGLSVMEERLGMLKNLVEHHTFAGTLDDKNAVGECIKNQRENSSVVCNVHRKGAKSCTLTQESEPGDSDNESGGDDDEEGKGAQQRGRSSSKGLDARGRLSKTAPSEHDEDEVGDEKNGGEKQVRKSSRSTRSGSFARSGRGGKQDKGRTQDGEEEFSSTSKTRSKISKGGEESQTMEFVRKLILAVEHDTEHDTLEVLPPVLPNEPAGGGPTGGVSSSETMVPGVKRAREEESAVGGGGGPGESGQGEGGAGGGDVMPSKRTRGAPKKFCSFKTFGDRQASRPMEHEEDCFHCGDGGELLECMCFCMCALVLPISRICAVY